MGRHLAGRERRGVSLVGGIDWRCFAGGARDAGPFHQELAAGEGGAVVGSVAAAARIFHSGPDGLTSRWLHVAQFAMGGFTAGSFTARLVLLPGVPAASGGAGDALLLFLGLELAGGG